MRAAKDAPKTLGLLHARVEQGNTVVVIEHNQPAPAKAGVIKTADWILDLGPEGGVKGGEIVAEGTPETVVKEPRSLNGWYLARLLEKKGSKEAVVAAE